MAIKKYNPTTPGRRQMTVSAFEEVTGKSEIKSLMSSVKKIRAVTHTEELQFVTAAVEIRDSTG